MTTGRHEVTSPRYGSMALMTPDEDVTFELRQADMGWFRPNEILMDEFGTTGEFSGRGIGWSARGMSRTWRIWASRRAQAGREQDGELRLRVDDAELRGVLAGEPHPCGRRIRARSGRMRRRSRST